MNSSDNTSDCEENEEWISSEIQEQDEDDLAIMAGEYLQSFWRSCPSMRNTSALTLGHVLIDEHIPVLHGRINPKIERQLSRLLETMHVNYSRRTALLKVVSNAHMHRQTTRLY